MNYSSFYKVNMSKDKPDEITDGEYGKFFRMLNYLSYKNSIAHSNGRTVKYTELCSKTGFSSVDRFKRFVTKLCKFKMVGKSTAGGIDFLFINPAYASRDMILNSTIYRMFKDDLSEFLNDFQKRKLELEEDGLDISSVYHLE